MKKMIEDIIFHAVAAIAPVLALAALVELVFGQIR